MTREEAIEALTQCVDWAEHTDRRYVDTVPVDALKIAIEVLQEPEAITLTYDEKCIFLAAIGRERRICREMDEEPELKQKPLVPIVDEIKRKVMTVLWSEEE